MLISHMANLSHTQTILHCNSNLHSSRLFEKIKKPGLPKYELITLARLFYSIHSTTFEQFLSHISISSSFYNLSVPNFIPLRPFCLCKLTNNIMKTIDFGKITILTALDMYAAFYTLDHTTCNTRTLK